MATTRNDNTPGNERSPSPANAPNADAVLKLLTQSPNQAIINFLAAEPSYPRQIASNLSMRETEVARRLQQMERSGLVQSAWQHIGKNVKLYNLVLDHVTVRVVAQGIRVEIAQRAGGQRAAVHTPLKMHIPQPTAFVGRQREMAFIDGPNPVVLIVGMPGLGKTTLAAAYAGQQRDRRVFWHTFTGMESVAWLANRFAVFMAQGGDDALLKRLEAGVEGLDRHQLLVEAIDASGALIVFDDTHHVQDQELTRVLVDTIESTKRAKLVLTSRERPVYDPTNPRVGLLNLTGLDDAAVERVCREKGFRLKKTQVPEVRAEVGGHPVALNLFLETARQLNVGVEELLDRVPERNLEEYLLREIHESLSDEERHVLGLASLFHDRFDEQDLASVSTRSIQGGLFKLRKRLLVQTLEDGYRLHEVVRNFFYNLQQDRKRLHTKLAERYMGRGTLEGRLEALHHFLAAGEKNRVLVLLEENVDLPEFNLIDAGYHALYLRTLELFKESDVPDARTWGLIQDEKGDLHYHGKLYKKALRFYEDAHAIFAKAKDSERTADLAWKRALTLAALGRTDEARDLCQSALRDKNAPEMARDRMAKLAAELTADAANV